MSMTMPNPIDTDGNNKISQKELKEWRKKPLAERIAQPNFKSMAETWGFAAGYLEQTEELQELLDSILQRGITDPAMVKNIISTSKFGLKYAADYIEADKIRKGAPEVWAAQVQSTANTIKEKAQAMGSTITDAQAMEWAESFLLTTSGDRTAANYQEFDEEWLDRVLSSAIDFTKRKTINGIEIYDLSGTAETQAETLYNLAYEYGMDTSMSNPAFTGWFENAVKRLAGKELTTEDLDDEIINNAISRFPGMAQQLQRGLTLRQAADPYLKAIADVLELDAGSINLDDNLVQQVLNSVDEGGNFRPMSIYEAKLAARRDPRWQYTETAKTEYTDLASMILKDFGFLG